MNPRLPLILSGAAATGVIGFGMMLAGKPNPGFGTTVAALLAVYAVGLGLGHILLNLVFKRGS